MRNEALIGYLLHQRPYQEKRALYSLFSKEHGVIHGVGKKGAPLFEPLQLFATGKKELKTFSQLNLAPLAYDNSSEKTISYAQIAGQQQYAALYLNEILWKLLSIEDPMPVLWQYYQDSIIILKQPLTSQQLRLCLRQFEQQLFDQLGFSVSLTHDSSLTTIDPNNIYRFLPDVGLVLVSQTDSQLSDTVQILFEGSELIAMSDLGITDITLSAWSRLYRLLLDHLLDYQPLQSRLLWQQQQRYR
ncbi:DNA repair protein RecO [Psychrobacter sp. GP33]|uniref:DNA repair protein RecO n=1 Tax=Psychrobacter sp. GP33 TaxID=2758709 RepID=UPI0015F90C9B|nr:DNA repair protein RecO C-terminal domain-containing protein [Psychrobacter sp. GP33]